MKINYLNSLIKNNCVKYIISYKCYSLNAYILPIFIFIRYPLITMISLYYFLTKLIIIKMDHLENETHVFIQQPY